MFVNSYFAMSLIYPRLELGASSITVSLQKPNVSPKYPEFGTFKMKIIQQENSAE